MKIDDLKAFNRLWEGAVILKIKIEGEKAKSLASLVEYYCANRIDSNLKTACREMGLKIAKIRTATAEEVEAQIAAYVAANAKNGDVQSMRSAIDMVVLGHYWPSAYHFLQVLNRVHAGEPVPVLSIDRLTRELERLQVADDQTRILLERGQDLGPCEQAVVVMSCAFVAQLTANATGLLKIEFPNLRDLLSRESRTEEVEAALKAGADLLVKQTGCDVASAVTALSYCVAETCAVVVSAIERIPQHGTNGGADRRRAGRNVEPVGCSHVPVGEH